MARMIGIVGLPSVPPLPLMAFRELAAHGRHPPADRAGHTDGWGAGWHLGSGDVHLAKAAVSALNTTSGYFEAIASIRDQQPRIAIAHLRGASTGGHGIHHTHPSGAGGWLFCHSGGDSEQLFPSLRACLTGGVERGLDDALRAVRQLRPSSSFTFLLTDGRRLVAYRDLGAPEENARKSHERYYTLYLLSRPDLCLVCSEPLPFCGLPWEKLQDGELVIISRDAVIVNRMNMKRGHHPGAAAVAGSPTLTRTNRPPGSRIS